MLHISLNTLKAVNY